MPAAACGFTIPAMVVLSTRQQRAGLLIFALGAGLVYVLWPYFSGLLGAPVLLVIFGDFHQRLSRRIGAPAAALIVIVLSFFLILLPIVGAVTLLANEAGGWARALTDSDLLNRLRGLEFMGVQVGEELKRFSSSLLSFVGGSALGIVGTGARLLIQFTITFFGLYYLLMDPAGSRALLESFIPFSAENRSILLDRFRNVTVSMLVGTFAVAIGQGAIMALTFWALGLPSPAFWGVVTIILSILPLVGAGLVWIPGAVYLVTQGRPVAAVILALVGLLIVGNVDTVIRPFVFNRYAKLHPFITIIGAFAFVPSMGLLGLLVGPLAISYFFELVRMYRAEYLTAEAAASGAIAPGVPAASP
jgi:predicted PurR-regulated permease PerM